MQIRKFTSLLAVSLALIVFSCRPENIRPGGKNSIGMSQDTSGWAWSDSSACRPGVHAQPNPGCTNSLLMQLVQVGSWTNIGQVVVQADPDFLYFIINPASASLKIKRGWFWLGPAGTQPPVTASGDLAYANFPYKCTEPGTGANPFVMMVPANLTFECNAVSVYAQFEYVDPDFPDDPYIQPYWAAIKAFTGPGEPLQDFVGNFCYETWSCPGACPQYQCFPGSATCPPTTGPLCQGGALEISCNPCVTIYKGVCGLDSAVISANITNPDPSLTYNYFWTPGGATTPSIKVSPNATTSYTVAVTAGTQNATCTTTVNVLDARAGSKGDKILVCYSPPGQPGVWVQKAVKVKYLGSYVPAYRYGSICTWGSKGSGSKGSSGSNKTSSKVKSGSKGSKGSGSKGSVKLPSKAKAPSKAASKSKVASGSNKPKSNKPGSGSNKPKSVKSGSGSKGGVGTLNGYIGPCGWDNPCTAGPDAPPANGKGSGSKGSKAGSGSNKPKSNKVPSVKVPSNKPKSNKPKSTKVPSKKVPSKAKKGK